MVRAFGLAMAMLAAGCGEPMPMHVDGGGGPCATQADCDDGMFCNGMESCEPASPFASPRGCVPGAPPCEGFCDEASASCPGGCPDRDGDGARDLACGGDDCDDADPERFPGNEERCDPEGHDEDCDPATHGGPDVDGDGFADARCCNDERCGRDCVDTDASVHPDATETCDGRDQDCDAAVDEGLLRASFGDEDGDLFGDPEAPVLRCPGWGGASTSPLDCDDAEPGVSGAQLESCNGRDDDCDGRVDEDAAPLAWYPDGDGDGFGDPDGDLVIACAPPEGHATAGRDCAPDDAGVSPGTPERCNARDDDCDGVANFVLAPGDLEDDDRDGFADAACEGGDDCDDRDPWAGPGQHEYCDGVDNDCDGVVDEAPDGEAPARFRDRDGDGFGGETVPAEGCGRPGPGLVARGGDCDDDDAARWPGAPERCDGTDQDCDGRTDEHAPGVEVRFADGDGDGFGAGEPMVGCALSGVTRAGDCDDDDRGRAPGRPELCNDLDDDCDGVVDEAAVPVDWYVDADGDGAGDPASSPVESCAPIAGRAIGAGDCDDDDAGRRPGADETCDGRDTDCDGRADEGVRATFYRDGDGDGAGDPASAVDACAAPGGHVSMAGDCDDDDPARAPGAPESCDGLDQDCDGTVDEGAALPECVGPGHTGACAAGGCLCPAGLGDCDGMFGNGCETDTATASEHCGGCGLRCEVGIECVAGTCAPDPVVRVQTGFAVTCALRASGRLLCAGNDWDQALLGLAGSLDEPAELPIAAEDVFVGGYSVGRFSAGEHRCVLQDAGATVRCWGRNEYGQLGDGSTTSPAAGETTGVMVPGGARYVELGMGEGFTCGRRSSGEVDCWGRNNSAQLGVGDRMDRLTPAPVLGVTDAVDLDVGHAFACVVHADGGVSCWGSVGPWLGDRVSPPTNAPGRLREVSSVVQVAAGTQSACARTGDGRVLCWGWDNHGQLGDGLAGASRATAAEVRSLPPAEDLVVGDFFACAVATTTGAVACWGNNDSGQLGCGSTESHSALPQRVIDEAGDAILAHDLHASGRASACARLVDGGVACFGREEGARFGDGPVSGVRRRAVRMAL